MSNKLVRFDVGVGNKVVVGESFPVTSSLSMAGVACDHSGNIYVSDAETAAIYRMDVTGRVGLFAGVVGDPGYVDASVGTSARFQGPRGLAVDKSGVLYVADSLNGAIRRVGMQGSVTTVVDGLDNPVDVDVMPNGDIAVAVYGENVVKRYSPGGELIQTFGSGSADDICGEVGGVKVKGVNAAFNLPVAVACDATGNIFVADARNNKIKKIDTSGWVTRYAGEGTQGHVLGNANAARFYGLAGMRCNRSGELIVLDKCSDTDRIKRVSGNGVVSTEAYFDAQDAVAVTVNASNAVFVVQSAGTVSDEVSSSFSSESSASSGGSSESSESSSST